MSIADAVREARRARAWSQVELGQAAGVSQSHVAKIEQGSDVRFSTLERVAGSLGLRLAFVRDVSSYFRNPIPGGAVERAREFGVDLASLERSFAMSPAQRLDLAVKSARGLARLARR